jgi:hypothetical protein
VIEVGFWYMASESALPRYFRNWLLSGRCAARQLAMLAAMRRALSGGVAALLATHQPQELGFVNVAVFDEAGD